MLIVIQSIIYTLNLNARLITTILANKNNQLFTSKTNRLEKSEM